MGNHGSHDAKGGDGNGVTTPRGSQRGSRSGSGGELQGLPEKQEKPPPSMVPLEKLTKFLVQRSHKEDGVNGVTENSFKKYLFPMYPELARQFFLHVRRGARDQHVPAAVFRQQAERLLSMLDDALITETYVRMFSAEQCEDARVTPDCLRALLYTSYKLAMDHYPDGPQTCLSINKTLSLVVKGCFGSAEAHSVGFVVRWLEEHCRRLVHPVHRYCVHTLSTRHRFLSSGAGDGAGDGAGAGLELGTPLLGRALGAGSALLPLSAAWLLAGAAPALYSTPRVPPGAGGAAGAAGGQLASAAWLARLLCAVPSHWAPLYVSRDHGLGANRFLHHTLAYRGPTIVLLACPELVVAICSAGEWRDSHQYWGDKDCALIQLEPTFCVVERGPRMLYLNTGARGYPRGLRAGADPRRPRLDLAEGFDRLLYQGSPRALHAIEVWGCGDRESRDSQLEVKKWQVREAERHRNVKLSAAEWIEHPDRYLLELAGRPQYNSSAS